MKKSALASVKSDRWRHLAPKYQTFGSIRVLKTGRFNFFSLHHYPQHKCGETLSPRCNGCVSMIQWWWARSSLSESQQPMEVKLEQLLRLQTTEGKRWNIETNLELSLISGPLNSVIAQTLWKREQSSDRRNRFMLSHCTLFIKSSCHDDMTWEKSM